MRKINLIFIIFILMVAGCATAPITTKPVVPIKPEMPGTYHTVVRGQTLWKISKIYAIDLDELVRVNRISDASALETGQLVFIPEHKQVNYQAYRAVNQEDFIWPLKGRILASYGQIYEKMINKGLNIQPSRAQEVLASSKGKVVFCANNLKGFGKTIIIDHGNGFMTVYSGNSQLFVRSGDLVAQGAVIAKVLSSDRNAYLHFEIRKGHVPQNPNFYLSN